MNHKNVEQIIADKHSLATVAACYHCGQECTETLWLEEKQFCCYGCKTVYEILNENNLCEYYSLDSNPGVSMRTKGSGDYTYLDVPDIRTKLTTFYSADFARVVFYSPAIHCISCIWLLENLQKIEKSIFRSEVNFAQKKITIDFNPEQIPLSRLADLITSLGYAPQINVESESKTNLHKDKSFIIKLVIAGFCFGNVMLFSFPEYLGLDRHDSLLVRLFPLLNLGLSAPVFFYSAFDYLKSASKSFKQRQINIDVPIAAGLVALFMRSSYDIITATGPGYLDSFTGLVFFLLIGRWFQNKTYESLAFDRDFKSYFPLAIQRFMDKEWQPVIIYNLQKDDRIRIRNMEIIPADSVLMDETAYIDYSFVTGESRPVKVVSGELIYAGGRLIGQPVQLIVRRKTSQSHLTGLWNNAVFSKVTASRYQKIIDLAARRFTWIVLGIALATAIYWQIQNPSQMWLVLTSVLMVACPCALALAAPFTYGSMQRVFGKNGFYLKNADVIERLAAIDAIVFDKTGTVTHGDKPNVSFVGELSNEELNYVKLLTGASTHPMSVIIHRSIQLHLEKRIQHFKEIPGKGIQGIIDGKQLQIGSAAWIGEEVGQERGSHVFVSIDGETMGYFLISASLRTNIKSVINRLGKKCFALLSGDRDSDKAIMLSIFGHTVDMQFNQSPHDKLDYIKRLQQQDKVVMMVGDGLNDSGALKQSDVGIAVTDDTGIFSPACDGILKGDHITWLDQFISLAKSSTIILKIAFGISFAYNAIALTFAVTGNLTPLVAAALMPLSSVSVVAFSSVAVNVVATKKIKSNICSNQEKKPLG